MFIGSVSSIEKKELPVECAKKGEEVCIKIDNTTGDAPKLIGRHFEVTDPLVTRISRDGLDAHAHGQLPRVRKDERIVAHPRRFAFCEVAHFSF